MDSSPVDREKVVNEQEKIKLEDTPKSSNHGSTEDPKSLIAILLEPLNRISPPKISQELHSKSQIKSIFAQDSHSKYITALLFV